MIAVSPVPTIIAALASRSRRRIANHFYVLHAISADDAVAFAPQNPSERRQFERMQARGIVRQAGASRYWLNVAAYQAEAEAGRRVLVPLAITLSLIIAGLITLGY